MAEVSLSYQYVLLLNDVVKENKALREKLDQTVLREQNALKEFQNKLDSLDGKLATFGEQRRGAKHTGGGKIPVPKMCSVSIHMNY